MIITLYDPADGRVIQSCSLQLPSPLTPEQATMEDWNAAAEKIELISGWPSIFGECSGHQKVVDGQLVAIEDTLDELKLKKTSQIDAYRDLLERSGFPYREKIFQSDQLSVARITVAVQAAQAAVGAGVPFEIVWTTADNTPMPLDAVGMMGVPVALATYADELHETGKGLKALVRSPETDTKEKIDAIQWPTPAHLLPAS